MNEHAGLTGERRRESLHSTSLESVRISLIGAFKPAVLIPPRPWRATRVRISHPTRRSNVSPRRILADATLAAVFRLTCTVAWIVRVVWNPWLHRTNIFGVFQRDRHALAACELQRSESCRSRCEDGQEALLFLCVYTMHVDIAHVHGSASLTSHILSCKLPRQGT